MISCIENIDGLLFGSFHEEFSDLAIRQREFARSDIERYTTPIPNLNCYNVLILDTLKNPEVWRSYELY